MKLRHLLAAAGALLPVAFSSIAPADAAEVTLKIAHFLPSMATSQAKVLEPWCAKMGELSHGRIACQFYPAMQLGGTPGQLVDQVKNGVADIVWTAPGYSAGRFPKTEVLELPGILPQGGLAGSRVIWSFYQQYLTDEYSAFKVLALHGDGGMNIHNTKHPVATLADFAGLKLRAPNRTIAKTLEALGAVPVAMPPAQMTDAISKGVVDGASAVWEVVIPTKLDEVTRFHTDTPTDRPVLGATVLAVLMNKNKYAALPADLKAIIDQTTGQALVESYGQAWDQAITAARDKVKASGQEISVISGPAYDEIRQRTDSVVKDWIATVKDKGIDGAALVAEAEALGKSQSGQ